MDIDPIQLYELAREVAESDAEKRDVVLSILRDVIEEKMVKADTT